MELLDKHEINVSKLIKKKIGILNHDKQIKIDQALKKNKIEESMKFIRKTYGDPLIVAYKYDDIFDLNNNSVKPIDKAITSNKVQDIIMYNISPL